MPLRYCIVNAFHAMAQNERLVSVASVRPIGSEPLFDSKENDPNPLDGNV